MGLNSRDKGKVGEREFAAWLREEWGIAEARRGQQFAGGNESPDVVGVPDFHFEVKRVEKLNIRTALNQADKDKGEDQISVVAHRRNREDWLFTIHAKDAVKFAKVISALVQETTKPKAEREPKSDRDRDA